MSLLRSERLHAVLSSGQIILARGGSDRAAYPLQGEAGDSGAALRQLKQVLEKSASPHARLHLMLAGEWARYALTAPVPELLSVQEEETLARQAFRERYGEASQQWTVRYLPQNMGQPLLACAADSTLIEGMQALCRECDVRLASLQPMLAVMRGQLGRRSPARDGWLVVVEPDRLYLVLLQDRSWMQMASAKTFGDWAEALDKLLKREATLHGRNHDDPVWMVSAVPGLEIPAHRPSWRWLSSPPVNGGQPYIDVALDMR